MHAPPQPPPIPAELLLRAYRSGIFPMADFRDDREVYWVEPKERAIIPLNGFRLSRSLRKVIRQNRFEVSADSDFEAVIAECAAPREDHAESWISRQIEASYIALNEQGHAHSVEVWQDGALVGGLYGVAFDRVFCGESMFSRMDNASKVALAWLVAAMRDAGYALLDCQFMTDHLASMGAVAMTQSAYVAKLIEARGSPRAGIPEAVAAFNAHSSPGNSIAQSLIQTS
ncbi:leucyl/phenylalanyl-tRNA--protein transferase [Erythrobacter litoralis]|uniref:leucyl/phenylalanyl-tRNA--protein transferase n=1 Tax=Erythrobacter litoralis TaxID=39960 RepID=UPI002435A18C|nr:leucyl/phenylalanyl-tRNA--protein transferase [Erythrobacter litoralis]MDG6077948.1 leucyl/phenylalanyl-tRNA--protein transferase [Erythrobacter litoralis]